MNQNHTSCLIRLSNISSQPCRTVVISQNLKLFSVFLIPQTGGIHLIKVFLSNALNYMHKGNMFCAGKYNWTKQKENLFWALNRVSYYFFTTHFPEWDFKKFILSHLVYLFFTCVDIDVTQTSKCFKVCVLIVA